MCAHVKTCDDESLQSAKKSKLKLFIFLFKVHGLTGNNVLFIISKEKKGNFLIFKI